MLPQRAPGVVVDWNARGWVAMSHGRYARHIPLIGVEGQEKLRRMTVLVAGVGGLGCFEATLLACLGVGRLVLVDYDRVRIEDLNRQILYTPEDLGKPKVLAAAERLRKFNPEVEVVPVEEKITRDSVGRLLEDVDMVVDGLDNWEARFILDEEAYRRGVPLVHAAVQEAYGQVYLAVPGKTPCLRCIFPPTLAETQTRGVPVLAPAVAMVASVAVSELVKLATGWVEPELGRLILVDARTYTIDKIEVKPRPGCTC